MSRLMTQISPLREQPPTQTLDWCTYSHFILREKEIIPLTEFIICRTPNTNFNQKPKLQPSHCVGHSNGLSFCLFVGDVRIQKIWEISDHHQSPPSWQVFNQLKMSWKGPSGGKLLSPAWNQPRTTQCNTIHPSQSSCTELTLSISMKSSSSFVPSAPLIFSLSSCTEREQREHYGGLKNTLQKQRDRRRVEEEHNINLKLMRCESVLLLC